MTDAAYSSRSGHAGIQGAIVWFRGCVMAVQPNKKIQDLVGACAREQPPAPLKR